MSDMELMIITKITNGTPPSKEYYKKLSHGKWIRNGNKIGYTDTITCSVCKKSLIWEDEEPIAFVYCPWCGAKLKDTEKKNENKSM